jgi:hypothetical protein
MFKVEDYTVLGIESLEDFARDIDLSESWDKYDRNLEVEIEYNSFCIRAEDCEKVLVSTGIYCQ